MRDELVRYLRELADLQHQRKHWLPREGRFDHIVHFLFDDTPEPVKAVGCSLYDEAERDALPTVVGAIEAVLAKYGTSLEDHGYIVKPEWTHVVEAASNALA